MTRIFMLLIITICVLSSTVCFSADMPVTPPPYWSVPKISVSPKIDGRIDESEWKNAASITGYQKFPEYGRGFSPLQTLTYTAWDDQYLYFAFRSPHTYRDIVLVNVRGRDAAAYTDEAFEVILWPPKIEETYAFVVGLASLYDARFGNPAWNSPGIRYEVSQHDGFFDAEIAIPWKDLEISPAPGMEIKTVLAHDTLDNGKLMTNWHYSSDSYHDKKMAGSLVLTDKATSVRLLDWGPIYRGYSRPVLEFANSVNAPAKLSYRLFMGTGIDSPADKYLSAGDLELLAGETKRIAPEWPVLDANLNVGRLVVSEGENKLVDFAFPFQFSPEIRTKVQTYPSKHNLKIAVDAESVLAIGQVDSIRVSVRESDKVIVQKTLPADKQTKANFEFDFSKFKIGDYSIVIECIGSGNTVLKSSQTTWSNINSKPDWMVHPVANERRVPTLFTPVIVSKTTSGAANVSMWGRTYTFDKSLFPTQIKSAGQKMLLSPLRLVGDINGKSLSQTKAEVKMVEKSSDRAVLAAVTRTNGITINTKTRVEFDGMYLTTITLTPDKPDAAINALKLEMPFNKKAATLMHWNNCTISGPGWAGETPAKWSGPYHPILWLGNEKAGLCWFAESINGWSNTFANNQLEVNTTGDCTVFAMNIVNKPMKLLKPLTITFGFTATPTKPLPKNWLCDMTASLDPWWDESNQFLNEAIPWDQWHVQVDAMHKSGAKMLKYTQTNFLSFYGDLTPEEVKEQHRPGNHYVNTPEKKFWQTEWETWPQAGMGGASALCKNSVWRDLIVAGLKERLVKGGVDGIYFDCSQPRFCNNPLHGCKGGYDILGEREVRRRLYNIFDELGREPLIMEHISDNMLGPVMNYSTYHYDGEQWSSGVKDYRDKMTLARMRAFSIGTNWGHIPVFMSFALSEDATSSLMGLWTLHMPWHFITTKWSAACEVGRKLDRDFHFTEETKRLGYWENSSIIQGQTDKLKSTIYYKSGSIFIVVANLSDTPVDASLKLKTNKIGFDPNKLMIIDSLKNQASLPSLTDGTLKCNIKPNTCVMCILKG